MYWVERAYKRCLHTVVVIQGCEGQLGSLMDAEDLLEIGNAGEYSSRISFLPSPFICFDDVLEILCLQLLSWIE